MRLSVMNFFSLFILFLCLGIGRHIGRLVRMIDFCFETDRRGYHQHGTVRVKREDLVGTLETLVSR